MSRKRLIKTVLVAATSMATCFAWAQAVGQDDVDNSQRLICGKSLEKTGGLQMTKSLHDGHGKLLGYFQKRREGKYVNTNQVVMRVQPSGILEGGFISDCKITGSLDMSRKAHHWYGVIRMSQCRAVWMNGDYDLKVRNACDSFEWEWERKEPHRVVGKMVTYPPRFTLFR